MREWYTGKPPFPRVGGHLVGWGWHGQRSWVSEVSMGEKWFSAPEGQKRITNLESKDEKLSVKQDTLEPFGITSGWYSLDLLPSLGLCWAVLGYALRHPITSHWLLMQERPNMPTWEWTLFLCRHVFLSINSLGSEHKFYFHLNVVLAAIGGLRAEEVCVCAYLCVLTSTFLARPMGMDGHSGPCHPLPCVPSCRAHVPLGAVGARSGRMGSKMLREHTRSAV